MKKLLLLLAVCGMFATACSSNGTKSVQDTTPVMDQTGSDNRTTTDTLGINANSAPKDTTNLDKKKPDSLHK